MKVHLISKACSSSRPNYPFCVSKIYIQSMHELIEVDADNQGMFYSNFKTNNRSVPIIFKSDNLQNNMDEMFIKKSEYSFDVQFLFKH